MRGSIGSKIRRYRKHIRRIAVEISARADERQTTSTCITSTRDSSQSFSVSAGNQTPTMSESFRTYVHPLEIPRQDATVQELLDLQAGEEWIWGQSGVGLYEG